VRRSIVGDIARDGQRITTDARSERLDAVRTTGGKHNTEPGIGKSNGSGLANPRRSTSDNGNTIRHDPPA